MKATRRNVLMGAAPVAVAAGAMATTAPAAHAWGVAELDAAVPHAPVPHSHVRHKGVHQPVNGHWHEANTAKWPHLAARSREELHEIRSSLLLLSNTRRLTPEEREYLFAANRHHNVRLAVDYLKGRHHGEFGFTGVDQVHMNTITYPGCGCQLLIVFDHHERHAPKEYFHHTPEYVCDEHAPHKHDLALLHKRVVADSLDPEKQKAFALAQAAERGGIAKPQAA